MTSIRGAEVRHGGPQGAQSPVLPSRMLHPRYVMQQLQNGVSRHMGKIIITFKVMYLFPVYICDKQIHLPFTIVMQSFLFI